jgi:poly [ADP-ribose] polymerase
MWIFVEISHREAPIITQEVLTLPKKVEDVLKLVFESSDLDGYVASLNARGRRVAFTGPRWKRVFQIGLAILEKQMKLDTSEANTEMRNKLATAYRQLVVGPSAELLKSPDAARKELESLELVLKLKDAKDILQNSPVSSVAFSQIIQVLGLPKLDPSKSFRHDRWTMTLTISTVNEETEEFRALCEYLHESSIVHHPSQFQVSRFDSPDSHAY